MATQAARFVRAEMKENGFLVVPSKARTYERKFGAEKVEVHVPKGVEPSAATHTCKVRQKEAVDVAFKVVPPGDNGVVQVWRKNGSGLKPMRTYFWTGTKLRLLTAEQVFRHHIRGVDGMELFKSSERPTLTHEQLCDVERALIRL